MERATRQFEDRPATRERVPLLVGLVGPSSSGKTFSALRLAAGMQRVIGGDIFFIDTEARRATHYADLFTFRHVDFRPPFGPLDYLAVIEHCLARGAKILVIDSMTHEHSGVGGVMDQSEVFLDDKCGDDWKKREKLMMLALARPKAQRKKLNAAIVQLGVNAVLCYRAQDKIKPVAGSEPVKLGWQPETTSPLHYDMAQRFLLTPGCEGVPTLLPDTDAEKRMVKNPAQFRDVFKKGEPLSEAIGQKLAEWAAGASAADSPSTELCKEYAACQFADTFATLEARRAALWPTLSGTQQKPLKVARDAAQARAVARPSEPVDDGIGEPPSLFDNRGNEMPKH